MSYAVIARITQSGSLYQRLVACAAQEGKGEEGPESWVSSRRWEIAASPGWAGAWASAEAGDVADPGANESVITDQMILATIQPMN